jgi:capsular exopolysaccharide synthesis family protein
LAQERAGSRTYDAARLDDAAGHGELPGEIDLRSFLRTLWRRKILLLTTMFLVTGATILIVLQVTPRYTATALVMIETRGVQVVELEQVLPALSADFATIESQVEILRSPALATKVIDKLGLADDPEFNPALKSEKTDFLAYLNPRTYVPKGLIDGLLGSSDESDLSPEVQAQKLEAAILDNYLSRLTARALEGSYIIAIDYESEAPGKSTQITNTIAELYLFEQLEAKSQATRRATAWLGERLATLQTEVVQVQGAVEAYRQTTGLMQSLKQQEIELMRSEAELSTRYGDKHPRMVELRAELSEVRLKIDREIGRIVKGLGNAVGADQVREGARQGGADALEGEEEVTQDRAEEKLRRLEQELEATQALYQTFLARFRQTSEQESLQEPDARIISEATIPTERSYPRRTPTVALAFVGSGLLGLLIILFLEKLRGGFRSTEELERASDVPVLGLVPSVQDLDKRFVDEEISNPSSAFGEAIRSVRAGLALSIVDDAPKVVLVTSSIPGEGKSTAAVSLALQVARSGQKCLLIDCDFRQPKVHGLIGVPNEPGLVDLLARRKSLPEVVRYHEGSGLEFVTAGDMSLVTPDLLASQVMNDLLGRLASRYDVILLDSSPVMVVSNTRVLSRMADKTILVVRWTETQRETVLASLRHLVADGAEMAGTVLWRVDAKEYAKHGFADSGFYTVAHNPR